MSVLASLVSGPGKFNVPKLFPPLSFLCETEMAVVPTLYGFVCFGDNADKGLGIKMGPRSCLE